MSEASSSHNSWHAKAAAILVDDVHPGPEPHGTHERIVAASLGTDGLVDVEKYWLLFSEATTETKLAAIVDTDGAHWRIVRSGVNVDRLQWLLFRTVYSDGDAQAARFKAVHGLRWANYREAADFLDLTEQCSRDKLDEGYRLLADLMVSKVKASDHRFFSNLARIVESKGIPESDKPRGGEGSKAGDMFRAFCRLHIQTKGLPTKRELRAEFGLGSEAEDIKKAGRLYSELGLSGLPEDVPSAKDSVITLLELLEDRARFGNRPVK